MDNMSIYPGIILLVLQTIFANPTDVVSDDHAISEQKAKLMEKYPLLPPLDTILDEYAKFLVGTEKTLNLRANLENRLKGYDTRCEEILQALAQIKNNSKAQQNVEDNVTHADTSNNTATDESGKKLETEKYVLKMRDEFKKSILSQIAQVDELLEKRASIAATYEKTLESREGWLREPVLQERINKYKIDSLNKSVSIFVNPSMTIISRYEGGPPLTGDTVWDASRSLVAYLDEEKDKSWMKGKKILDLSGGTGYVGVVAACFGGDVTITDIPQMIPLIQKNINANLKLAEENGGKLRPEVLRWGNQKDIKALSKQDIIFMSNIVYYNESLGPLISTAAALSNKGTTLIVSQELWDSKRQETLWAEFVRLASKYYDFFTKAGYEDLPIIRGTFR